jgi:hypothetical protein
MKFKVQTGLEDIEAEFPQDAFEQWLRSNREVIVIVEEEAPETGLGFRTHEFSVMWPDEVRFGVME